MRQAKSKKRATPIEVAIGQSGGTYTECAGVLALWHLWQEMEVAGLLKEAGIHYGKEKEKAPGLSFAATIGPLVGASSDRRIAQRFGGEPSPEGIERDELLSQLVEVPFSQRTMNRFMGKERHDWRALHQARVSWLQCQPGLKAEAKGVVIVDDYPTPKPYAEKMEYLSRIRDQNQNRTVPGFQMVHLYYHHPQRPDYSLYVQPWRSTSATGETKPKPSGAVRPARPDEEQSRLDIALAAVRDFLPLLADYGAVIFDSWYTARWLGHALTQLDARWIGVAESSQKFELTQTGDYLSVPAILERFWQQCRPLDGSESTLAVAIEAIIRPDRYTKMAQAVQLVLARAEGSSLDDAEPDYYLLICNQPTWSAQKIVSFFQCRPEIEQAHRQGKQWQGWVDFQHLRWSCLQAYLAFALLRSLLLTLLIFWQADLAVFSVRELISHAIQSVAFLLERASGLVVYLARGQPAARRCLAFL